MGFRSRILIFLLLIETAIAGILYTLHNHNLYEAAKERVLSQSDSSYHFIGSLIFSHSYMGELQSLPALQKAMERLTHSSTPVSYVRIRHDEGDTLLESRASYFNAPFTTDKNLSLDQSYYCSSKLLQLGSTTYWVDIAINLKPIAKQLRQEDEENRYYTLALLLCITILGFWLSRDYGKGIASLNKAVKAIESGQLGYTIKQKHLAELEPTAQAFNHMSERLAMIANEQNDLYRDLLQKDRRLELVLNSTDEGILGLNANREICIANASALSMLQVDDTFEINLLKVFPQEIQDEVAQLYRTQIPFHLHDVTIFNSKGVGVPIVLKGSQIGLQNETFTILSLRDLTAEKNIQRQVEEQNTLKAALMDASLDSILLMDNRGHTLSYNLSLFILCNQLDIPAEEIDALTILQLDTDTQDSIIGVLDSQSLVNTGIHSIERITNKQETLHLDFNIQAFDANGKLYYTLVITDVSQNVKNQLHLKQAIAQADAANIAKSQFLAAMSHEIRTPLNGIHGSISLLANSELTQQQKELLHAAEISSEALMQLINDILDFAKIEAGKMELEISEVSVQSILEEASIIIGPRASEKGLNIQLYIDPNITHCVICDAGRLRQICLNLLSNAVKFTQSGDISLYLDLLPCDQLDQISLRIRVSDPGIGIAPEKQALLFNEFTQVNQSDSRRFGGSGLGLAISQKLAELMGGYIVFSSEKEIGSQFCLYLKLPITNTTVEEMDCPDLDFTSLSLDQCKRILVVEDSITNQMIASRMLETLNQQVEIACNGLEALQALATRPFDLILMDLQMPEMNGYQATEQIRQQPALRDIPIIAMTANVVTSDKEQCFEVGMNDFLPKPVHVNELQKILVKWLGQKPDAAQTIEDHKAEVTQKHALSCALPQKPESIATLEVLETETVEIFSYPVLQQMEKDIGRERCQQMIDIVLAELEKRLQELLESQSQTHWQGVGHQAHTLKSTSASFGLMQLAQLAKEIEHLCRSGDGEASLPLIEKLPNILKASQQALNQYRQSQEVL